MAKILIIDDDPDITESMKVVLESEGYEVRCADSGKQGLAKTTQENPDLIILDVMMETKSKGFDVSRELRRNEKTRHIPIIMLTAIKDATGMDFKKEAGDEVWLPVDDYCDKPLRPEELLAKIKKLLARKG